MRYVTAILGAACLSAMLAGCEATAKSDRLEPGWQTTASWDAVFARPPLHDPIPDTNWPPSTAEYAPPVVTHFPFWYYDPFVSKGDGDELYGWTCVDWFAMVYSPVRYAVNTIALPVSAVFEPPGVLVATELDIPIQGQGPCPPPESAPVVVPVETVPLPPPAVTEPIREPMPAPATAPAYESQVAPE